MGEHFDTLVFPEQKQTCWNCSLVEHFDTLVFPDKDETNTAGLQHRSSLVVFFIFVLSCVVLYVVEFVLTFLSLSKLFSIEHFEECS